ncbi:UNVERIFIED_CONTAM: hypothetical protein HDU68_000021 [Siphonaria sp. JEL0065]|nr:hypothetical protein HDU68_000021 [Siphonaria sp. JEL0065]
MPVSTRQRKAASSNKEAKKTNFDSKRHSLTTATPYYQAYEAPPFTLKELRDCVPAECFKHNTLLSLAYAAFDLTVVAILFYIAIGIDNGWNGVVDTSSVYVRHALWFVYSVVQGWFCTGLWVIAHECGHGGFSANTTLNHAVGWVLHSALLVPYFSWKITHSMHHKACGNMDKDQVFVPRRRSDFPARVRKAGDPMPEEHGQEEEEEGSFFENAPLFDLVMLVGQQVVGWPAYVLTNATGQRFDKWASHFHTSSPVFSPHHANQIIMSDIGLVIAFSVLGYLSHVYSFVAVFKFYILPYLWVNHWLVMITFLQHTDVRLPHYRGEEWDFLKGALCTVDRDFGILNYILHHITDTHVAHHLFSNMPFYNAGVATAALKKKLGKYYLYDDSPIFLSLWRSFRSCKFVEDEDEIKASNGAKQLPADIQNRLFEAAVSAKARSYSPYSKFPVGASVLTESGDLFLGCNVENVSYGGAICAERTGFVKAVSEGHTKFIAVAVVTNLKKFTSPCGFCRQFMVEFGKNLQVYLFQEDGSVKFYVLRQLLPDSFGPEDLEQFSKQS